MAFKQFGRPLAHASS